MTPSGWERPIAVDPKGPMVRLGGLSIARRDYFDPTGPYVVTGDTFAVQEDLMACGGTWDPRERAWTIAAPAIDAVIARLQTRGTDPEPARARALAEEPAVGGWGQGSAAPPSRARRLRRLLLLPPELWADEEVMEVLFGYAFPDLDPEVGPWLLERFGGFGGALAAEPPRFAEHPTLKATALAEDGTAAAADGERSFHVAMLLKAVGQVLQRSLREELKDRPVIGSWAALIDYLQAAMQHDAAEHFRLLFLDRKNILIRDEVQSRGTVDHTPLYPREVVKRALELGASAIIMVHNHPSGDPTPSQADIDMTRQVSSALAQVNVTVHDHIIVGRHRHTSFKTQKLI
jgi:DNA repair protein RadC